MRQNKPYFIGITGGIGAGKSELLSYIGRHYSCEIYLADQVAHEVKRRGTPCYHALTALLGEDIVSQDGEIDRAAMAEKIFADEGLLKRVNGIVHPAVKEYLLERLEAARRKGETDLFFVEAALLIEGGYGRLADELWYVYADEETRRRRLKAARGYSDEKIDSILASQLTEEAFRENCVFIIDNSGPLPDSFRQIDERLKGKFTERYIV